MIYETLCGIFITQEKVESFVIPRRRSGVKSGRLQNMRKKKKVVDLKQRTTFHVYSTNYWNYWCKFNLFTGQTKIE